MSPFIFSSSLTLLPGIHLLLYHIFFPIYPSPRSVFYLTGLKLNKIPCRTSLITLEFIFGFCYLVLILVIVQIWVSSSDRTTPIEREMESPVETHTSSLLSGGRAATYARVVSGLLSYTLYDGRVAACTRMESGPPACGPASPRQPFRYFRVKLVKRRLSFTSLSYQKDKK